MSAEKERLTGATNLAAVETGEVPLSTLIARTADADESALAALYDATAAHVHGVAMRILQDESAAEEVTVDVYRQVWHQAARYDPARGRPLAWLLVITRSRALDRRRSVAAERSRTEPLADGAATIPSAALTPEESCGLAERRRLVQHGLARLAAEQRQVIELAYFGGSQPKRDRVASRRAAWHGEDAHPHRHDALARRPRQRREGRAVSHSQVTDELRALAAAYVLGSLEPDEARRFEAHLAAGCNVCDGEAEGFAAVADDLALAVTPVAPPPASRARLFAELAARPVVTHDVHGAMRQVPGTTRHVPAASEVRRSAGPAVPDAAFVFLLANEGGWQEVAPGVSRRALGIDAGTGSRSYVIRMNPGSMLHGHAHAVVEHCYILEGDFQVAGRRLESGDYHLAPPGTTHDGLRSEGGCLFLVVECQP